MEQLYLAEEFQSTQQLKDCLIRFYVQVLVFLVKAKRFYEKSTASELQSLLDVSVFELNMKQHTKNLSIPTMGFVFSCAGLVHYGHG